MADNKVTIDADYFAELWNNANKMIANESEYFKVCKERDELKAKLATAQNYEDIIAAKDREIACVIEERNRLNATVNELVKQKEAAEKCIKEIEELIGKDLIGDGKSHSMIREIIRAYREAKGDNQ